MNSTNIQKIKQGIKRIKANKKYIIGLIIYTVLLFGAFFKGKEFLKILGRPFSSSVFLYIWKIFILEMEIIGIGIWLMLYGTPRMAGKIEKDMKEQGIVDMHGNAPVLLEQKNKGNAKIYEFYSRKIPLKKYDEKKAELETVLNIEVTRIEKGIDVRHIVVTGRKCGLLDKNLTVKWNDKYLSHKEFELVLGVNAEGLVKINIDTTPHVILGGESGSGKSMLLKLLLYESIKKEAEVKVVDMKGGLDYQGWWKENCKVITEREDILSQLEEIVGKMLERNKLFSTIGARNITEYNEAVGERNKVRRMVVAFDEVAEILDKTGVEKEEKKEYAKIEQLLTRISRIGRAYGINLILCTQRPSTEIIKGEIRVNLGTHICGRADRILSQMLLGNSVAEELISPEDQGVFVMKQNTLFKAYYLDEQSLE